MPFRINSTPNRQLPTSQHWCRSLATTFKASRLAWVGDANNVLYDLCIGARKLGVDVSIATPKGYEVPSEMMDIIQASGDKGKINTTLVPEEAVKNADVIVTDTWVSMGQESEYKRKSQGFRRLPGQ